MKNFQKIRYYQNKEKRITTAVIRFSDIEHEAGKIWDDWNFYELNKVITSKNIYSIPDVVAVTHAAECDKWDDELGKKVAKLKLERQIYKRKRKWIAKELEDTLNKVTMLNNELIYANKELAENERDYENLKTVIC